MYPTKYYSIRAETRCPIAKLCRVNNITGGTTLQQGWYGTLIFDHTETLEIFGYRPGRKIGTQFVPRVYPRRPNPQPEGERKLTTEK